jgi:hypothetical protein
MATGAGNRKGKEKMSKKNWFDVDADGFGQISARKDRGRVILELVQNAVDEEGTTMVEVVLEPIPGRPAARLVVRDDNPEGFADLRDSFTLFGPSKKKDDPAKRGFMNLGEKIVLSLCNNAQIVTTKGTVVFDNDGRKQTRQVRDAGSVFEGEMRMTRDQLEEASKTIRSLIPPDGVTVLFNGEVLRHRQPLREVETRLPTVVPDEDGNMRRTERKTRVRIYTPEDGEVATLYEMGIPVVETGDKYHVDIQQKVPLNMDRDNVTPAYLQKVRVLVLNEMHSDLSSEDATEPWVRSAASDENCSGDATEAVALTRFGEGAVAYDPNDPEANKRAAAEGRTVVCGGSCSGGEWENMRRAGAVPPAGQVTPSNSDRIVPPRYLPESEWTDGIRLVARYAEAVGRELLGETVLVEILNNATCGIAADYGRGKLRLNVGRLGKGWFKLGITIEVDKLLIHEFAHHYESDHLSEGYYDACCRLGARLKRLAIENPDFFAAFQAEEVERTA